MTIDEIVLYIKSDEGKRRRDDYLKFYNSDSEKIVKIDWHPFILQIVEEFIKKQPLAR